ncbi:hypothetical protein LAZ67_20001766 [Cordylochernes scorpioides]|uniref:Reverse transcriptase domain-containing protein n=1 Tax=Cordylochernes scorpioides TaxID=51811 RepID=A0ABY6LKL8_9ARAC|nr:hypothetical protein LAZ67_20001766 [Cordylochernes scorpioides]
MNRLKKGRRPVRGQITKLINSVEKARKKPVKELDKTDLRVSALQLEYLCRDLHEWNEKITKAMLYEEVTEAEQDNEYDEHLKYNRFIKRMREELEKVLNLKKSVSPQPDETSLDTSNSTSRRRVLLSKRKLPEFGGDVREWITFWSRFEYIHNYEDLTYSDKYQYLLDCMLENSESQQIVLRYPVSGKNYASVINDLKEIFRRDNMLIKVYVRDLLWLLNSQIRHLSMLGVTTDKCADILYPVVESCLQKDVLILWQRSSESEDLESLMKFLHQEVNQTKDREMAYNKHSDSLAQPTPGKIETKKISFNARREVATTTGFMHSDISPTLCDKFKCIFCDNGHPNQDCRKGMKMGMDQKKRENQDLQEMFQMSASRPQKQAMQKENHAESERKSPQRPQNSTPTPGSSDVATVNEISNCLSAFEAESDVVELLLDADINPKITTANMIRLLDDLIARETLLGWVVQGKTEEKFPDKNPNQVSNLWSLENIGVVDDGQEESKKETDQVWTETKRLDSDRNEVHLPWIEPANKSHAEKILRKMTEDLKKRGFYHHYNKIFKEWEENGVIERIQSDQDDTLEYFLPHRAVVKSGSSTTPVRLVFNASYKAKGGWSLNDCLAKGPNLLELIPDIMLSFILDKTGVVADIEKAFLQISTIFEISMGGDGKQDNLYIYQHKRVVFGVTLSPFLLAATLKLHLEQYENERGVIPLLKYMYMDNCVNSVTSLEEAQSIDLLSPAGFNLREWQMGSPEKVNSENISVLGMKWDTADNTLTISDKLMMTLTYKSLDRENDAEIENLTHKLTKRIMLLEAHAVYDPLGLFSPFIIVPMIILQQLWKSELKRDQPVPEDIANKIVEWQSQIPELLSVRIPMWVMRDEFEQASLHVFCYASRDAYATCIYLRMVKNKEINARVAPKRNLTIPRLELMSCLIRSRLTKQIIIDCNTRDKYLVLDGLLNCTSLDSNSETVGNICQKQSQRNLFYFEERKLASCVRGEQSSTVNITVNSTKDNFIDKLERCGDYHFIVWIVAYLLQEFEEAEKVVLRHIQLIRFGRDGKRINKLNAFADEYRLYRIKSNCILEKTTMIQDAQ